MMSRKMYIVLLFVVILQGLSIAVLLFRPDKKAPALPVRQENSLWQVQKALGDRALEKDDLAQAVYFYENILRELPPEHPQRENLQKKITGLYERIQGEQQEKKPLPKELKTAPSCYRNAELAYQDGDYLKARQLFNEFLAQQDKNARNRKLTSKACLRLNQCRLFSALETIDRKKTREDLIVSQALKLMQR